MNIDVTLTEKEVLIAIAEYISRETNVEIIPEDLHVEVKSKQNYKSEWEKAAIRVKCDVYKRTP